MSSMLTLAGNAAPTGFYDFPIEQSLRFNDDDSAYLSWTPASAGNRKTWTWSSWMKRGNLGEQSLLDAYSNDSNRLIISFSATNALNVFGRTGGSTVINLTTSQLFRDVSSWYHIVLKMDTTQATSTERVKIYVNGVQVSSFSGTTYPTLNYDTFVNATVGHSISSNNDSGGREKYFDGYMAEINFIDGQALDPTSFGEFKSGIWIPKNTSGLTFGTNGFRLEFGDSAAIGDDTSGNTNDWTVNNLVASDVVLDSPTNNFATLNVLSPSSSGVTFSEGNLKAVLPVAGTTSKSIGTIGITSGKWYWETRYVADTSDFLQLGVCDPSDFFNNRWMVRGNDGETEEVISGSVTTASTAIRFGTGDIIGIALDADNGKWYIAINGAWQLSADFDAGTGYVHNTLTGDLSPAFNNITGSGTQTFVSNFGQDSTFAGNTTAGGNTDENGYGDFKYAPPSGFLSLCSANLPSGAIDTLADETPEDYFNTVLYSGDSSASNAITGVGFQPDLVWIKERNGTFNHVLQDVIRGSGASSYNFLATDNTDAETSQTDGDGLLSLDTDGFTVGFFNTGAWNETGSNYASWNWKANGSGVSNTDGSITSTVSVGATSQQNWFSIVSYTGNKTAGATVGHGLGVVPDMIIVKNRDDADGWRVYHSGVASDPETDYLELNSTAAAADSTVMWNDTAPTSSVFSLGTASSTNQTGENLIAYCFANAEGLCKVGKYTGNGSTDGTFVYTGHKPSLLLIKSATYSSTNWLLFDNKREIDNPVELELNANNNNVEGNNGRDIDFVSNGFKIRSGANNNLNTSGGSYIFLSISEQPFKFANAR